MFKKIFAVLTVATVILSMTACGKDEQKVPELTEDGKKIIKIYTTRVFDLKLFDIIRNFNARSNEYEVQLTELTVEYGGEEGMEKFNAETAAGHYPDILIHHHEFEYFPIESYEKKGAFADLYDFMDADPDINKDDFVENLLKQYERDGKLYTVMPYFQIQTLVGKTSIVGGKQGIDMDNMIELLNEYPDNPFGTSKSGMLSTLVMYGYNSYIDSETGKCSFDGDEFIKLLELCNSLSEESREWNEYSIFEDEYALLNGTMPFNQVRIYDFGNIRDFEYGQFGEPVTFIGYPGVGGNGSVIVASHDKYSIFAHSANAEGAWEFLKYFYSENYQDKVFEDTGMFPIRRSSLEKVADKAKQLIKDYDTNELVEPSMHILGKNITIGVNTDEDNQRIYDLIDGAVAPHLDINVTDIIGEEASFYFSGQRSSEETAEIIQNRVQNYIDESR